MNKSDLHGKILLKTIRSGQLGRNEGIELLYKNRKLRNSFKKMIRNQGWPVSDFDHIFDNALILFATTVIKRPEFELKSNLFNYILIIGKHNYMREINAFRKTENLDDAKEEWNEENIPVVSLLSKEKAGIVQDLLGKLGKNCKEVLMYWANAYNMKEIATLLGYKSDMMARKKKYQCLKELSELVGNHPQLKETLRSI